MQVDMCALCLGNNRNHRDPRSGKVVKRCHKYTLDVFPEMEKGGRSSAICNPEEQTEMSSGQS